MTVAFSVAPILAALAIINIALGLYVAGMMVLEVEYSDGTDALIGLVAAALLIANGVAFAVLAYKL